MREVAETQDRFDKMISQFHEKLKLLGPPSAGGSKVGVKLKLDVLHFHFDQLSIIS